MAAKQSVSDMQDALNDLLTHVPNGKASMVEDYAKIASLMTDKEACDAALVALNAVLVNSAEQAQLRKTNWRGRYRDSLKSEKFRYTRSDGTVAEGKFKKHGNMLKTVLDRWEQQQGFNRETHSEEGLPSLPASTPLLTGFVQPPDFRKYLLKHGYHWTDIGVAERHGEFTHRLHWYIICRKSNAEPNWLTNDPVTLFKECGESWTVENGSGNTVWDTIVDFLDRKNPEVGYRNPENLHAFLTADATCRRKDMWAVGQVIRSRKQRVALINETSGLGKKKLDSDLEVRADQLGDGLTKKGDISQHIIWQNIQEGVDTPLIDEFLRLG